MMQFSYRASLFAAVVLVPIAAQASSSQTEMTVGGSLRIVTSGAADAGGMVRASLEIGLAEGWKTYWLDPGAAGVPPLVSIGGGDPLPLAAPAPERVDDGVTIWAGYKHPVAFRFALPAGGPQTVDVFIGVCEKICVPVQAALTLDPLADPDNSADAMAVAAAEAAMPLAARPDFHVGEAAGDGDRLHVSAVLPEGMTEAELFLSAEGGWAFGAPKQEPGPAGTAKFTLWHDRPAGKPAPESGFLYVLRANGQSVTGRMMVK